MKIIRKGGVKMQLRDSLNRRSVELCDERGLSINKLANMSAIPPTTVYSMFDGKCGNPSFKTIKMICDSLDMDIKDFFDSELFINLEKGFK